MPSERQKKLAKELINNQKRQKPLGTTALTESVGYAKETARAKQTRTIKSKGVQTALEDLGFTEEGAKKVVEQIMYKGKEENRLKACDMNFKIHGSYAPEKKQLEINKINQLSPEELKEKREKINKGELSDEEIDEILNN